MGLRNRWNYSGYPYFITTTVVEWAYVFKRKPYFDILCESLVFCKNKYASKLLAYCLMPNHIHYIHANPVKKGLVSSPEDWFYSRAREYMSIGSSAISVDTEW